MSGLDDVIDVNKNGERFVKEDARRDEFVAAIKKQPGAVCYDINDASIVKEFNSFNENVETLVKLGRIYKSDTLAGLAKQLGMPAENLEKTVAEYNKMVEAKSDTKFGRKLFDQKIEKAPFYATPRAPSIHHTMGGLEINTKAQVVDVLGNPIPGLYAAGEVTGGIHGSNRLGGNATADVLTFGRIAAKSALGIK
ncbi:fumarate reductase flavoprotein subunit [Sutterella sp. CAG:397]|nr:fumarate reductase flavoprotein subunit [Sutterella sp. CAG:397]